MRPLTIDLDELAFALDTSGVEHYLDLGSGQVLLIPEDDADPDLLALLDEPERLLPIEPLSSRESIELMRDFLREVDEPHAYSALANALEGRKPFKAFKHVLMGYPELLQAWYAYQAERLRECALDWLADHDIRPAGQALARH
ncbi:UPF0158 family protein [Pseudomonas panipatensis]|uniref:Uncharacterized protein family (UPF0158) n=1 Tax=Pseudomonas panipatensis TaxID=428992 RepID=A0A1G8J8H9_9PSED|nr:UPF0158 family protein [Pseudomonas panipatensis]SDI27545.1 Uncharacterised protein family (UPF0158) [Pseudomonas panipatensis]SMP50052.1 Uncharacterised protein family (UPF0158) [Pseudomonas panipatensis]